jgi:hypothetical protein
MPPCVQPTIRMAWPGVPGFYGLLRGLVLSPSGSSGLTRVSFSSALADTARVTVHGTRPLLAVAVASLLLLGCSLHHPNESAHVVQKRHRRPKPHESNRGTPVTAADKMCMATRLRLSSHRPTLPSMRGTLEPSRCRPEAGSVLHVE